MGDRRRHLGWNPDSDSEPSLLPSPPGEQFSPHPHSPRPADLARVRVTYTSEKILGQNVGGAPSTWDLTDLVI